jgi:hypothetical protein
LVNDVTGNQRYIEGIAVQQVGLLSETKEFRMNQECRDSGHQEGADENGCQIANDTPNGQTHEPQERDQPRRG